MTVLYKIRIISGISLLILFALASNIGLYKSLYVYRRPPIGGDFITQYEKRFEELKKDLLPKSTVGYITDIPIDQVLSLTHPEAMEAFYLAQYSLAPVATENGITHPLVLGNFHSAHNIEGILSDHGLMVQKNYGNGIFLLRRKAR